MFFSIDPNNGVAIYEQIVRQVKLELQKVGGHLKLPQVV
jgi:DNA-binding transcriptional regulator YhcF (GntR family)